MSKEELDNKLNALEVDYKAKVNALRNMFANVNNPYKVGDTITDHCWSIVIDKIVVHPYEKTPSMIYEGFIVKKSGEVGKKRTTICQSNIIKN